MDPSVVGTPTSSPFGETLVQTPVQTNETNGILTRVKSAVDKALKLFNENWRLFVYIAFAIGATVFTVVTSEPQMIFGIAIAVLFAGQEIYNKYYKIDFIEKTRSNTILINQLLLEYSFDLDKFDEQFNNDYKNGDITSYEDIFSNNCDTLIEKIQNVYDELNRLEVTFPFEVQDNLAYAKEIKKTGQEQIGNARGTKLFEGELTGFNKLLIKHLDVCKKGLKTTIEKQDEYLKTLTTGS